MTSKSENLVGQIDLLEAQLEEREPRLFQTKFLLERKKKLEEENDKDEIKRQLVELKRKLVDRKVHHSYKVIRKQVKQAIKVESLKVQKRKGKSPEKAKKIDKEADELKKFESEKLAQLIILRNIKKSFLSTKRSKENPPEALSPKLVAEVLELKDGFNDVQNDIFARLCKQSGVHLAIEDFKASLHAAVSGQLSGKAERQSGEKDKAQDFKEEKHEESEGKSSSYKEAKKGEEPEEDNEGASDSDSDSESDSGSESESETEHPDRVAGAKYMDISGSEDEGDDFLESANGNLPSLQMGYVSGSDDEDARFENDKVVKELTSGRKNRRGQRARRKIWEAKYGKNAKHLVKERKEQQEKLQKKQERRQRREEFAAKAKAEKEQKKKQVQAQSEKPLHPSWQAKKQTTVVAPFQGQKKKFD
ncbi:hypothetical protein TRICI_002051 [Trichomonascus ciferrii]|uniref:Bud22 domain-containing protein n=1 Tax=Trichomonascus ciferrii TaxID=44093 RepID=A0A642V7X2_9ASCO|nr:hypothetical protein TRICI_002051 [Trichomonascus ciferrii]